MATKPSKNFASLASSIVGPHQAPTEPTTSGEKPKDKLTSFELSGELRTPLDRVVHGMGRKGSAKAVLNAALRFYFEHDEKAKRLANTPTPDESE